MRGAATLRQGSDDCERQVISDILQYGWHCLNVSEDIDEPGFSFSIGFFETWKHPEIIVVGLPFKVSHSVLELVAAGLADGRRRQRRFVRSRVQCLCPV